MGFDLPRSLLAEHGTPEVSAAPPPPPPLLPTSARPAVVPFRPSVAVIVVVLTTMFSLTFLLLLYAKHCRRQAAAAAAAAGGGGGGSALSGAADNRNSGVERAVVESLPLFRFASLVGEKEGIECAVCLGRFEPEELLRLLPKCRHAFHVDCVDAWLDFHSTCPLCRSRVHPEDVFLLRNPDPLPPPPPAPAVPPGRRISGRHSSAGEKSSVWAVSAAMERQRKDGLLLQAAADGEGDGGRFSHRVLFSGGGAQERWSDLRPSDLMFLRSETTITTSGRFSAAGSAGARIGPRSASVIAGITRLSQVGPPEDGTMRRWLSFAGKRTAGWLGGGNSR